MTMSAYMVSDSHIHALVDVAQFGPAGTRGGSGDWNGLSWRCGGVGCNVPCGDQGAADAAGRMLVAENARSMRARYGPEAESAVGVEAAYSWAFPRKPMNAVQTLKAIDCYQYQACEADGWPESEAHAFCEALRSSVVAYLPGYGAAPWGCPDDRP